MKISKLAIYLGLLPAMLLSSCATIMHGTKQSIGISSNPANAGVWIDGQYYGQTPMIAKLARQDNHFLRIELEGFMPYEVTLTKQMSGWVFGNVIFGGLIGVAVDAITGGIYRLTPEQVHAQMYQNQMTCTSKGDNSYIAIVLEPEASWEKIGQLEVAN
jgi:hypothetical protein